MIKEITIRFVDDKEIKKFDCGNKDLNSYFIKYAKQNDSKNISRTFVLQDEGKIVGFYTLTAAQIRCEEMPQEILKHSPRYPLPAIRIARFAIDKKFQKKGYGKQLLKFAFKRIILVSVDIGIAFVIIYAKKESKEFYEKHGFICIDESTNKYIISIKTLIKAALNN